MDVDKEETGLSRPRQQYHYFYGSTDDRGVNIPQPQSASSPTATDQDSLVGEALVLTDNENEGVTPNTSEQDFEQLIMTKGNGIHPIIAGNGKMRRLKSLVHLLVCSNFREQHPVLYSITLIGTALLSFLILAVVTFPNSRIAVMARTPESELRFVMPFPRVDRAEYDDPVSSIIEKDLFHPSLLYRGPDKAREFIFAFPTGAFWTNLVLPPTADRGLSYPVAVYPYAYKWSDSQLQVSYPAQHRDERPKMVHDYFFPDLSFASEEVTEVTSNRYITAFDPLSVTLRYTTNNGGQWETYLVQGSPYITIKYDNVSPVIRAFSIFKNVLCPGDMLGKDHEFGVCTSKKDQSGKKITLMGVQFILQSQEGMYWMAFSSEPIGLVFDTQKRTTVASTDRFKGVLRLAIIPTPPSTANVTASKGLQRLIYHAGVYPVSADVSFAFRSAGEESMSTAAVIAQSISRATGTSTGTSSSRSTSSSGRIGTINFQFTFLTFDSSATTPKPLLMLALPHHAQSLPRDVQLGQDQFDLVYKCIKGPMRPVLGSLWTYDEPLPSIGFDKEGVGARRRRKEIFHPVVRPAIVESLHEDIKLALPTLNENVYGFGKQSARLAQLAHIAYELLQGSNATSSHNNRTKNDLLSKSEEEEISAILEQAVRILQTSLEHWLLGNVSDPLLYDRNLGGMVSKNGLADTEADFGNGRYNDHHFHYGYTLYACAILGRLVPKFVHDFGNRVDAIYYDIAHDSNFDSKKAEGVFFPSARHKVWFDGHSFASGLFPFGNGKSQESSSEAVNGYYGAYLWSLVRNGAADDPDSDISTRTDFARLLLATEIRGAQLYWHMQPLNKSATNRTDSSTTVYSPEFSKNYMVGNLGMLDALSSTWFGTNSLYVHMINELPITAVTEELFDRSYVSEEYSQVIGPLGEVEMAWQGYVVCNHAIVDPQAAWPEAQKLFSPQLDSALSKSEVLYWVSTRSDFNASKFSSNGPRAPQEPTKSPRSSGDAEDRASCSYHPACVKAGLQGECCPTSSNIFLECCSNQR